MCAAWQNPAILSNMKAREPSHPILPLYLMRCRFGRNLLIIGLFTLQLSRYHARNYDNVMPRP
ncbi:MAG: hypothetical protein A2X75_03880 [Gallionellales bacterium GWE2_58_10]|nr:MAG: hypothetical protein A2X75_03880 [Gallionellales bacterium GWE2_58_10]